MLQVVNLAEMVEALTIIAEWSPGEKPLIGGLFTDENMKILASLLTNTAVNIGNYEEATDAIVDTARQAGWPIKNANRLGEYLTPAIY